MFERPDILGLMRHRFANALPNALPGHEAGLDSDAVWILEQRGVVAGRPVVVFLRSANDLGGNSSAVL
jgi:hypothetical protein